MLIKHKRFIYQANFTRREVIPHFKIEPLEYLKKRKIRKPRGLVSIQGDVKELESPPINLIEILIYKLESKMLF